jgi:hypothetical protein
VETEATVRRDIQRYRRMVATGCDEPGKEIVEILLAVAVADLAYIDARDMSLGNGPPLS